MFKIIRSGPWGTDARVNWIAVLTPQNFQRIADEIGSPPIGPEDRLCRRPQGRQEEMIETHSNGKETTNTARPGDYIVTNLSPQREPLLDRDGHLNIYVIRAAKFADLYEPTGERGAHGAVYRAKGVVSAIPLPGGFDIAARWGER